MPAVLTFGLSSEYAAATQAEDKAPDADRSLYSRYYVRSLLKLDEDALKNAWSKVRQTRAHRRHNPGHWRRGGPLSPCRAIVRRPRLRRATAATRTPVYNTSAGASGT
jgi:hypothetical protein